MADETEDEDLELDPMAMAFVLEYMVDRNGSAAARRCGWQGKNPSWFAWKTLRNPAVQALIEQMTADKLAEHGVRVDTVMRELSEMAFANIGDFIDDQGNIDLTRVPKEKLRVLESYAISESEGAEGGSSRSVRIKMASKLAALEKVQKYLGIAADKLEVDHKNSDGSLTPTQKMTDEQLREEAAKRGLPTSIFGS